MESTSFVRYLKQRWMASECFQPPIAGCTDSEIAQLLAAQQVDYLPELYREFMQQMGREDGGLEKLLDADLTYAHVLTFKDGYCLPLLRVFGVDRESFVFLTDRANFLYFFDTGDRNDDPMVFTIYENSESGAPHLKVEVGNLSDVLVDFVERCFDPVNWKENNAPLD